MFLQQLHYWLQKPGSHERDGKRWVYNTYEGWHQQFPFWSAEAVKKIVLQLEKRGIIETSDQYNRHPTDRTKWYTINYEALNALFDEADSTGDSDDSNAEGAKSNAQEGARSTEHYQESTETTNRDSVLHTGDRAENGDGPPEKVKPKDLKQFAVAELMDRVKAAKDNGSTPHPLPDSSRRNYGRFFEQASKDGYDVETLLLSLDYLVAKASGTVEGEPKAWAGFGTALDKVTEDGWRPPKANLSDTEREKVEAENEENRRMLAELIGEAV